MNHNSIETILLDIRKLFKELDNEYGKVKPYICEVTNEKCPNTNCWVQKLCDEKDETINRLDNEITDLIDKLNNIYSDLKNSGFTEASNKINEIIIHLTRFMNPTPCSECNYENTCQLLYKSSSLTTFSPCHKFLSKNNKSDENSKIFIQFQ